jgi:hypothetical protein
MNFDQAEFRSLNVYEIEVILTSNLTEDLLEGKKKPLKRDVIL